jgi:hypothetical protein
MTPLADCVAMKAGLRQHCPDVIRISHGASRKNVYKSNIMHELLNACVVFEKPKAA